MSDSKKQAGRRRPGKNTFTTKSGHAIKLNRSLSERLKASRDARARRRATYLSTLPKNRLQRILYRLQPRELARFWFSRDGAIMALKITGVSIVVFFVLIVGVFAYFRKDLPNIKDLSGQEIGGSLTYYDRSAKVPLWQDYNEVKRQAVPTTEIAKSIRDATVAIEDKDFYKHGAFDVRGILRAGINNALSRGGGRQGGSTISQQLVKLDRKWTAQRNLANKIKEVILAVEIEREYSKDDILTGYLNLAPYGPVAVGVQVAAQDYFGIDAKDLTVPQAAMLAGIPKAPSTYSPYGPNFQPDLLLARQRYIIDQMAKQKMITKVQAEEAKAVDILAQVKPQQPSLYTNIKAPYFVLAARAELKTKYGANTVQRGGWKVITTLDLNLQKMAEEQVQKGLPQVRRQLTKGATIEKLPNAAQIGSEANIAFAAMDVATGQMVAAVGGADFSNKAFGELNYVQTPLPPGSSFKPYDYMAMLENTTNTGAGSVIYDSKDKIPGYAGTCSLTPKERRTQTCPPGTEPFLYDYDIRFPGPVTLRYSLAGSRNVPAVKAMLTVGVEKTIDLAESMGLRSGYKCYKDAEQTQEDRCYASSAIGDGAYLSLDEHVNGYATMSRLGTYLPKTYILKIVDSKGGVVDEWKQPKGEQVTRPDSAFIIMDVLSDPRASYMSKKAQKDKGNNGWSFALKTGTTNDAKDGWMMGTSAKYAAGVWVGHGKRESPMADFMETMTLPIWQGWMQAAHKDVPPANWAKPSSTKTLPAFVVRGHVGASSIEPSPETDLFPSWYQARKGSSNTEATIDLVTGKLATTCTPDLAKKTENQGDSNFSADIFHGGGQTQQTNTDTSDDVHICNDSKPEISLTAPATCEVTTECVFTITVTQGTHSLSGGSYTAAPAGTVSLIINDQTIETLPIPPDSGGVWSHSFKYTPTATGEASIKAQVVDSVLYSSSQNTTAAFTN